MSEPDWQHYSTLHLADDGEGVLDAFKALRSGTLAELVAFVASLPEEDRVLYAIEKEGERRIGVKEIMELSRRDDFPG